MTISYGDHFWKVFFVWRGSLWKTIYKDLAVFLVLYFLISASYRLFMNPEQRAIFERLVPMFEEFTEHIPLTFMLGFYVGMVVKRWWDQFQRVLWPDDLLYWVSAYIRGNDEETTLIRKTLARYVMLATVMGWRSISTRVLKRFPTLEHVMKAGLMTELERKMYEDVKIRFDPHKQWFLPLNWASSLMIRCYDEERISHVNELRQLLLDVTKYRNAFMQLYIYDWINIPLVYTQVAVVATYGYFALCLIGRQYIQPISSDLPSGYTRSVDLYFPFFTVLQFLFYVGWLKVGEDLMNPFGEDDEDFEFNYLLDRHMEMSFLIVDDFHMQLPGPPFPDISPVVKGRTIVPHTKASKQIHDVCPLNHVRKIPISQSDMEIVFAESPIPSPVAEIRKDWEAINKARKRSWILKNRVLTRASADDERVPLHSQSQAGRHSAPSVAPMRRRAESPPLRRTSTYSAKSAKSRAENDHRLLMIGNELDNGFGRRGSMRQVAFEQPAATYLGGIDSLLSVDRENSDEPPRFTGRGRLHKRLPSSTAYCAKN